MIHSAGQSLRHWEPVLYVKVTQITFHFGYYALQTTVTTIEINYLLNKETIKLI